MTVAGLIHQLSGLPGDAPVSIDAGTGGFLVMSAVQQTEDGGVVIVSRGTVVGKDALAEYHEQRGDKPEAAAKA